MTREIIKRLFDTYVCRLIGKNKFAIDYEEATVDLTDDEIALLTKAQEDKTINKELEPILKKFTRLFYLGQIGDEHYLYILTPKVRAGSSALRTFMGLMGKTVDLSEAEYDYLDALMDADTL